jgi:hypothetical protein
VTKKKVPAASVNIMSIPQAMIVQLELAC